MDNLESTLEKRENFISKLRAHGYDVEEIGSRPIVYSINGRRVGVRSRDTPRVDGRGSRRFWYDVSTNVLDDVELLVYLMTESDFFVVLPSDFLARHVDRMYTANGNQHSRVFDINWDDLTLVLQNGEEIPIDAYYHNLVHETDFPTF